MSDQKNWLNLAVRAARAAGEKLLQGTGSNQKINYEDLKDVKLQADIDSEKLIRQMLCSETSLPIVGEEEGGDESLLNDDQYYWIVDPLDGTYNYLREVPLNCVSIGLFRGETPILGVIYDFNRDEIFTGIVGEGFYINGNKHIPNWADNINKASLVTGFPAGCSYESDDLQNYIGKVQVFQKVRLIGTASLAIAYVAAGRFDVYYEEGTRIWDIAAGLALVIAAGGVIDIEKNKNLRFGYKTWAAAQKDFICR